MTKKNCQEINFHSGQDLRGKLSEKGMPIIRCICGFEILVVPDLKAMNVAIKTHLTEHKKQNESFHRVDWLEEFLTEQILVVSAKQIN
jgi:hypothetical protein